MQENTTTADLPCGKTSPVLSVPTKEQTLQRWLEKWQDCKTYQSPPRLGQLGRCVGREWTARMAST